MHNDIVVGLDLESYSLHNKGRNCFQYFHTRFKNKFNHVPTQPAIEKFSNAYKDVYEDYNSELAHYFNHLHRLIEFVDKYDFDKQFYINIIKSQLSSYENAFIYYHHLSEFCDPDFKIISVNLCKKDFGKII